MERKLSFAEGTGELQLKARTKNLKWRGDSLRTQGFNVRSLLELNAGAIKEIAAPFEAVKHNSEDTNSRRPAK